VPCDGNGCVRCVFGILPLGLALSFLVGLTTVER